jgi:hypothetical protein
VARGRPARGNRWTKTKQAVLNAHAAATRADFRVYPGQDHYSVPAPGGHGGAATDIIGWFNSHMRR